MHCAAHPEIEARGPCAVCFKNLCDECASYDLDGAPCCERCGRQREEDSDALSSGLLTLVGVGYLATLAIGIVIWRGRPFVGGLAAIVAIGLGRAMQLLVKAPVPSPRIRGAPAASRRLAGAPPHVDATAPPT
jgi:hypothetical protein